MADRQLEGVSAETPQPVLFFGITAAAGDGLEVTLTLRDSPPVTLLLEDHVYSLLDIDGMAIHPRPAWMMASPTFISGRYCGPPDCSHTVTGTRHERHIG